MEKEHRGISLGTILMLSITGVVLLGCAMILPGLMGQPNGQFNVQQVLKIFETTSLPSLQLSDIPIASTVTQVPPSSPEENPLPALQTATPAPTATLAPTPTPKVGGTFTLTIGGTVNMDDAVRKAGYYSDSQKYDFSNMLAQLSDVMTGDMTMVMTENLIVPDSKVSSLIAPDAFAEAIRSWGIQMITTGFSKAYDKGADGLRTTLDAFSSRNRYTIGAYNTAEEAATPLILTLQDVPVAFLHYTGTLSATSKKGVAKAAYAIPLAEADTIAADIGKARDMGAAVVIVTLDWGATGASKPTTAQKKLAQSIADAGADVIVGAGTRVAQPITWLTRKNADGTVGQTLCAWSLGSLLNESRKDGNVAAMLLHLQISWDGSNISFYQVSYTPTYIWRQKLDGQYQYRVVASNQDAPAGMSDEQAGYMRKARQRIETLLADSPVTERTAP